MVGAHIEGKDIVPLGVSVKCVGQDRVGLGPQGLERLGDLAKWTRGFA